eukprot:1952521-Pyramimonas_sp.AAC.1
MATPQHLRGFSRAKQGSTGLRKAYQAQQSPATLTMLSSAEQGSPGLGEACKSLAVLSRA